MIVFIVGRRNLIEGLIIVMTLSLLLLLLLFLVLLNTQQILMNT